MTRTRSRGGVVWGSMPCRPRRIVPPERRCVPARAPRRVDFPAPLRPISTVMVPRASVRSKSCRTLRPPRATESPSTVTVVSGLGDRGPPGVGGTRGPGGTRSWSRSRNSSARRRASRIDRGVGVQPASRDNATTGGWIDEIAMAAAGSSSCEARPASMRTTWSAWWITRSRRCSASTTVTPRSWTIRCREARTSSAATGSSADVGSSRTRIRGPAANTEAMATRCCCPPDRASRLRARSGVNPNRSSVSSTRRRIVVGSSPIVSIP